MDVRDENELGNKRASREERTGKRGGRRVVVVQLRSGVSIYLKQKIWRDGSEHGHSLKC